MSDLRERLDEALKQLGMVSAKLGAAEEELRVQCESQVSAVNQMLAAESEAKKLREQLVKQREAVTAAVEWLRRFERNTYNTGFLHLASDAKKHASALAALTSASGKTDE